MILTANKKQRSNAKMRSKKPMKKISDADVKETYAKKNRQAHRDEIAKQLLDTELFSVNVNKGGLKAKREKLAADRFKIKNTEGNLRSKTEVTLLKKLAKKGPVAPVKKTVELFDVWGGSSITGAPKLVDPSKRVQKFKDFSKRSMTRVKPVMAPHAG